MPYDFDPEVAELAAMMPPGDFSDPAATREQFETMVQDVNASIDTSGLDIRDFNITGTGGDVPVRLYQPSGESRTRPAILHLHGGGFVVGSLNTEFGGCVDFVRSLDCVVLSVDYRLAPEHPYPAGLEDCYSALQWLHQQATELSVDPARIAVLGQSAGGGLAAALALLVRERGGPDLCFQFLGIPELDDRLQTPSMQQFVDTPMWSRPLAEKSWAYYLGDGYTPGGDTVPATAAPARATDLSDLPPAYINTMEFDPLRDEGIEYALKLMAAGVKVELHSYPGTFHGSSMVPQAAVSQRQREEMMGVLQRALAAK